MRMIRPLGIIAGVVAAAQLAAQAAAADTPEPAKPVDLQQLAGRWYEVARTPNMAEAHCPFATTDWQPKAGGKFEVTQTCRQSQDAPAGRVIRATADPLDPVTHAKWRMNYFGGLIRRDYWVIDHAMDSAWVILGMPGKHYLWVLARKPDASAPMRQEVTERVTALGYDASRLEFPLTLASRSD